MYRMDEEAMANEADRRQQMEQGEDPTQDFVEGDDPEQAAENQQEPRSPDQFSPAEQKAYQFIVANASKAILQDDASASFLKAAQSNPASAAAQLVVHTIMTLVHEIQRRGASLSEDVISAAMGDVGGVVMQMLVKAGIISPQQVHDVAQQAVDEGHKLYLQLQQQLGGGHGFA